MYVMLHVATYNKQGRYILLYLMSFYITQFIMKNDGHVVSLTRKCDRSTGMYECEK